MTEKEPDGLGFEGWLKKLSRQSSDNAEEEKIDTNQPLDDMAKMRRLMEIDRRFMFTMPRTMIGLANETGLQDLKEIAGDYRKLLQAGPPQHPFYTEQALRKKIADVLQAAARACVTLRDYQQAGQHYVEAAEIYTSLGEGEEAELCRASLAHLKLDQGGGVDDEIKRLHTELAAAPAGSIDYARTLIELAGLYSSNGDDYEAETLLLKSEKMLDEIGGDPSGGDLAEALTQSLLNITQAKPVSGPTAIETKFIMNGLYRQLFLALARIYQARIGQTADREQAEDYQKRAENYLTRATQRDSRANNDEFSEYMLKELKGILGAA